MAFFKEVFIFTLAQNSWTEIYYSSQTDLTSASTFADGFIALRLAMLASEATLAKIRVTDTANLRSGSLVNFNRPGLALPGKPPDVTGTAAVVTLNAPSRGAKRQVWMRGLPDDYVMRDLAGNDNPPTPFIKALDNWIAALAFSGYQIPALSKVSVPPAQPNVYTRITQAAPTVGAQTTTITFANTYTPQLNNRAIISQCSLKTLPGINGHWTVLPVNATSGIINYVMPSSAPVLLNKGVIRPEIYNFGPIDGPSSKFNFYRGRKTGKNFQAGRGRRTAVRLRSL